MRKFKLIKNYPDSNKEMGDVITFEEEQIEVVIKSSQDNYSEYFYTIKECEKFEENWEELDPKRKVIITLTEVAYRHQTIEIEVDESVDDDDVGETIDFGAYEIDENVEWIHVDSYDDGDLPGVDSDRFDVWRGKEQMTGGH